MKTLYLGDLANDLAIALQTSTSHARTAIRCTMELLGASLLAGNKVAITGFGVFKLKRVGAKTLTCPATGKRTAIEAHACPAWQPSGTLKARVRAVTAERMREGRHAAPVNADCKRRKRKKGDHRG